MLEVLYFPQNRVVHNKEYALEHLREQLIASQHLLLSLYKYSAREKITKKRPVDTLILNGE